MNEVAIRTLTVRLPHGEPDVACEVLVRAVALPVELSRTLGRAVAVEGGVEPRDEVPLEARCPGRAELAVLAVGVVAGDLLLGRVDVHIPGDSGPGGLHHEVRRGPLGIGQPQVTDPGGSGEFGLERLPGRRNHVHRVLVRRGSLIGVSEGQASIRLSRLDRADSGHAHHVAGVAHPDRRLMGADEPGDLRVVVVVGQPADVVGAGHRRPSGHRERGRRTGDHAPVLGAVGARRPDEGIDMRDVGRRSHLGRGCGRRACRADPWDQCCQQSARDQGCQPLGAGFARLASEVRAGALPELPRYRLAFISASRVGINRQRCHKPRERSRRRSTRCLPQAPGRAGRPIGRRRTQPQRPPRRPSKCPHLTGQAHSEQGLVAREMREHGSLMSNMHGWRSDHCEQGSHRTPSGPPGHPDTLPRLESAPFMRRPGPKTSLIVAGQEHSSRF